MRKRNLATNPKAGLGQPSSKANGQMSSKSLANAVVSRGSGSGSVRIQGGGGRGGSSGVGGSLLERRAMEREARWAWGW